MKQYIDNITGKSFPQAAINGGYVFILFSPVFIKDSPLISAALFFGGLLLSFTVTGSRIDLKNKRFKEYTRYFWVKIGSWTSLENFPFITLITSREASEAFSFKKDDSENDELVYGIYLLNRERSQKVLLKKFKDKNQAILELSDFAKKLGANVITVNHF